jgi:uncharacterized protein
VRCGTLVRMSDDELRVVDVPASGQYELRRGEEVLGRAEYRPAGADRVILSHTVVDDGHEHEGLGSRLAAGVLDDLRAKGTVVIPTCPFMAAYIDRHPEYGDLVG